MQKLLYDVIQSSQIKKANFCELAIYNVLYDFFYLALICDISNPFYRQNYKTHLKFFLNKI